MIENLDIFQNDDKLDASNPTLIWNLNGIECKLRRSDSRFQDLALVLDNKTFYPLIEDGKRSFALYSEIEKLNKKIQNRLRSKKYRETHKEEIAARNKLYLANLDPEIVKQRQQKYNQSEKRKESSKAYYEAHKQEIMQKAKDNPRTKINQQRYKAKKRFQERTGSKILSLLQALAEAKSR